LVASRGGLKSLTIKMTIKKKKRNSLLSRQMSEIIRHLIRMERKLKRARQSKLLKRY